MGTRIYSRGVHQCLLFRIVSLTRVHRDDALKAKFCKAIEDGRIDPADFNGVSCVLVTCLWILG